MRRIWGMLLLALLLVAVGRSADAQVQLNGGVNVSGTFTAGNCLKNTVTGAQPTLADAGACAGLSGLVVGTTTVGSGTTTRVLFDNAGVLGEYTVSGSGNVALTTSPVFTTPNLGTPSALNLTNATALPVGSLTGTTLPASVVTSSLTTVGTIGTGTWAGTTIIVAHGGTGLATWTANAIPLGNGSSNPTFLSEVDGDCVLGSGGVWTAGSCGGSAASGVGVNNGQSVQGYGDVNQTLAGSKFYYHTTAALTTTRTWTLPASATGCDGTSAHVCDIEFVDDFQTGGVGGAITSANTLTFTTGGTDKLNGVTNGTLVLYVPGSAIGIHNDGAGNYTTSYVTNLPNPSASKVLVTNGSSIASWATTLPSGLTAPSFTVTTAFTATGLVTYADIVNGTGNNLLRSNTGAAPSELTAGTGVLTALGQNVTGSGGGIVVATGPTMSNPVVGTQAATDNSTLGASTAYVTTAITNAVAALNPAVAVVAATTAAGDTSSYVYANGVSGVGATLTGPTNNVAVTFDGITLTTLGQRVLVKNDTQSPSGAFNGIYTLTILQGAANKPVLTRALDFDQSSDINSTGAIPVTSGTVNATTSWVVTSTVTTVGTDPVTFAKFSIAPSTIQTTTLTNTHIWVGNGSNLAVDVAASGDLTLANTGAATLAKKFQAAVTNSIVAGGGSL